MGEMEVVMGKRSYSMDAIRVLATVLVIIVHTIANFFSPEIHANVFAFFKVIGTVGVPLFVILTGYLMFDRNYEDNSYLRKYLFRNLLPLFVVFEVWNIVWNILRYTHVAEAPQKWINILKAALFMGDTLSALWYLPMSIALYLGMPILSTVCHKITLKTYQIILLTALALSGTLIPSVAPVISLTGHTPSIHSVLRMNIFGASVWGESVWMIYLLSGYAISKGLLKQIKTTLIFSFGIIIPLGIMVAIELAGHSVQHYDFILVVLLSISTFELLTRTEEIFLNHKGLQNILTSISKFSFAIYMMHIFVGGAICRFLGNAGMNIPIGKSFPWMIGIVIYAAFIMAIILIVWFLVKIISKNRFLRRYVLLMK